MSTTRVISVNTLGAKKTKLEILEMEHPSVGSVDGKTDPATCAHWLRRKKRHCKMTAAVGMEFCCEHMPPAASTEHGDRIPCPLDSKHTVYKKNLQKHLKICNARESEETPPYIEKNVNAGSDVESEDATEIKLNELPDDEFYAVVEKVKALFDQFVNGAIDSLQAQHNSLDEELAKEEYGKETKKHLLQTAALLGILEKEHQLPSDNTSFIEFGAGKGQLAFHLASVLQDSNRPSNNSHVILLDRMSLRHKRDNKIEDRSLVQRIRADIADLRMERLALLRQRSVAFSKHLCGAATDLTLRCVCRSPEANTDFIMIAVCCHHRCEWRPFAGKEFFRSHGVTPRQFRIITKMVGWAICGTGMSRERRRALEEQPATATTSADIPSQPAQRLALAERERVGFMCKRVLDHARLEYLRARGFSARLCHYVPRDVTLENVCLLARRSSPLPPRVSTPTTTPATTTTTTTSA